MPPLLTSAEGVYKEAPDSRYWDNRFQRNVVKLLPGAYYATCSEDMVATVLGSCIAACIYDPTLGIGGINHFMLPVERKGRRANKCRVTDYDSAAARYGNVAMELLINDIIKLGGTRVHLQAKIFGGGCITRSAIDIGAGNIAFVREYLELEGIRIIAEDVGGRLPRKLYYIPSSNDVFVKKIERMTDTALIDRDNRYFAALKAKDMHGEVCFLGS